MPAVEDSLADYESIARTIIEWVSKTVTVPGELIVNINFFEMTPGTLELQVDCVTRN